MVVIGNAIMFTVIKERIEVERMKIVKNNYTQTIFPPVTVRCAKCRSIIRIEQGDATLNEHLVWEWKCPCCNKENKSGCQWQLQLVK